MPRPKKTRFIAELPTVSGYVPENTEPNGLIELTMEGLEAIRLCDHVGLDHEGAAARMGVSRQTFGRILAEARLIVADALLSGKRLRISGGSYCLPDGRGGGRQRRRRGRQ